MATRGRLFGLLLLSGASTWSCSGQISGTMDTPLPDGSDSLVPVGSGSTGNTATPPGGGSSSVPPVNTVTPTASGAQPPPSANPDGGQPSGTDLAGTPLYTRFARLTNSQWANSVQALLGLASPPSTDGFEDPVEAASNFLNNERLLDISSTQHDAYELAAENVIKQVMTDTAMAKIYSGTDAKGFIETFGRRAYRRPLTQAEVTKYEAIFEAGSGLSGTASSFTKGASLVIQTMLQSPHFLYRVEDTAANQQLNGYEIAAKLSLWLVDRTPSDSLLDQAPSLTSPAAIGAAAESLLEQPEATTVMGEFFYQWMDLRKYNDVNKDPALGLPTGYAEELRELSARYFQRIYSEGLGLKEILTGTKGFVGPKTAALYGVQASSISLVDFGEERTGYFAQVPYTMLYGTYGGQSDIVHRGVHLQKDIFCGVLPPAAAVFMLPEQQPNQTNRDRLELMTSPDACASCHENYINPLGFAFENFDGLGRPRTTDNGSAVDTTSSYPFPEQTARFTNHRELMLSAFESKMPHVCYAIHLAGYGLGRDIVAGDQPVLDKLAALSMSEASMKDLVVELVKDPAFIQRSGVTQ